MLPRIMRRRFAGRPALPKTLRNMAWLSADSVIRMALGVIVGAWMARYLGVDQYGQFNYALSFVALITPIAAAGLNGITVREIIRSPDSADQIIGTSFAIQVVAAAITLLLALIAITVVRPHDDLAKALVLILSLAMFFRSTDTIKYWFESRVEAKYVVLVENSALFISAAGRIGLMLAGASLIWFAVIVMIEAIIVSTGLLLTYRRMGGDFGRWRVSLEQARWLLSESWPQLVSGLAVIIYMRIDQLMLGEMLGNTAVGVFSAAVRISEIWYFIPVAIVSSLFPALLAAKKTDEALYLSKLQHLHDVMALLGVSVAILVTFTANWIIWLLFGPQYHESATVLAIHTWGAVFVFLSLASGRWFLAENLQIYAVYRTLCGVVVNIALNLYCIPGYGPIGAGFATLFSQAASCTIFNIVNRRTRPVFIMQMRALFANRLMLDLVRQVRR